MEATAIWRRLASDPYLLARYLARRGLILAFARSLPVNFYDSSTKMGLHQDRNEAELAAPVVSISLGDSCSFRYGGLRRNDPAKKPGLLSGDVIVMGGPARLLFHGVDRIYPSTSDLLPYGGRINLTLRRVSRP